MSSTGRKGLGRVANDAYYTPPWCIAALLAGSIDIKPSWGRYLEPCAGEGAFIKGLGPSFQWSVMDIDPDCASVLEANIYGCIMEVNCPANFLTHDFGYERFGAVVSNPPFDLSFEFIQKAMTLSDHVIMLMRLNWLGSIERHAFLKKHTPDIYILTPRPSFMRKEGHIEGATDSCEYAFFHFHPKAAGKLEMLPLGPTKGKKQSRSFHGFQ
jgi:predicted RNA methylase